MKLFRLLELGEAITKDTVYAGTQNDEDVYLIPVPVAVDADARSLASVFFDAVQGELPYGETDTDTTNETLRTLYQKGAAAVLAAGVPQLLAENEALKQKLSALEMKMDTGDGLNDDEFLKSFSDNAADMNVLIDAVCANPVSAPEGWTLEGDWLTRTGDGDEFDVTGMQFQDGGGDWWSTASLGDVSIHGFKYRMRTQQPVTGTEG